ncbi:T9SS type A sorting domain-containing protein [Tenacibaculum agarivorans]|uniref:T9SS type A sorting domain-containing protein n=1 Tax=Tenacibaculum agarivorans TaxID=1908389 RepID=UPI00094BA281|nr:T9SS type A sorting domain-containing protein [Tenacibaculum agarivorans]
MTKINPKIHVFLIAILLLSFSDAIALQRPFFNKSKDILIAQFDSKPDPDDIHAQAALGCMLAHEDLRDINYYGVAGAVGNQEGKFIDSHTLFDMAFGPNNWTDANANWNASVTRIADRVIAVLQNGGKAWVQEAGQSNLTADWIAKVMETIPTATVISNVVVVQHGRWNEDHTDLSDLKFVRNNSQYFAIDDGNLPYGSPLRDRGQWSTPEYRNSDEKWMQQAKSSTNQKAKELWIEADRILNDTFPNGLPSSWLGKVRNRKGVDFSDCSENWWIFNVGDQADTISKFWSRYVTGTSVTDPGNDDDDNNDDDDDANTNDPTNCASVTLGAIDDFSNINVNGFAAGYRDFARNAVATKEKGGTAAAITTFTGETGAYNITLNTLTELDGESVYKIFINDNLVGEFTNPTTTVDFAPASHVFSEVEVTVNSTIRVEYTSLTNEQVVEKNGFSFARARWTSLDFKCIEDTTSDPDVDEEPDPEPVNCSNLTLDAINDFSNINVSGFAAGYRDVARDAVATKVKGGTAAAITTFIGETGTYNITLHTLTELDGESVYKIFINDDQVGEFTNPTTTVDFAPANYTFTEVDVTENSTIRVEYTSLTNEQVVEKKGFSYARARWTALDFKCVQDTRVTSMISKNVKSFNLIERNAYPNPTSDFIYIENTKDIISINVSNTQGILFSTNVLETEKTKIDLSGYPKGVYFLTTITTKGVNETIKVIKE